MKTIFAFALGAAIGLAGGHASVISSLFSAPAATADEPVKVQSTPGIPVHDDAVHDQLAQVINLLRVIGMQQEVHNDRDIKPSQAAPDGEMKLH